MTIDAKRLQRLLSHRLLLERVEEGSFAEARQDTARREQALQRNQERRVHLYSMGAAAAGPLDPAGEQGRSAYTVRVGREVASSAAAFEAGKREEAARRERLLERRRDRMAIEALLERQQREAKQLARRRQLHRDDEWAARNWVATRNTEEEQR